jgi:hypothetical protein
MGRASLAGELGELVCMDRRIQTLNDDSVVSLAVWYLENSRGVTLADLGDLVLAGWNRLNVGPWISLPQMTSAAHPEFLDMVHGRWHSRKCPGHELSVLALSERSRCMGRTSQPGRRSQLSYNCF